MDRAFHTPPRETAEKTSSQARIDKAFDALVEAGFARWVRYAHLQVGNLADAELIAYEVAIQLHESWEQVLRHQNNVQLHALGLLRGEIERWRQEHGVTDLMVENAAFLRAMRAGKSDFALLAESIGVYSAIARLPERQYQVVVLRFALGYDVRLTADLMNISPATVASLTSNAKRGLARELSIDLDRDVEVKVKEKVEERIEEKVDGEEESA